MLIYRDEALVRSRFQGYCVDAYMGDETGSWQTILAGESPEHAGCSGEDSGEGEDVNNDDNDCLVAIRSLHQNICK